MRKIVAGVFQSLDGVMQAPGGEIEDPTGGFSHGGWQMAYSDKVAEAAIGKLLEPPYSLLLGRRTYEIFASYWPHVTGEEAGIGQQFTAADKYVLTHGDQPLTWANSYRIGDLGALAEIKASNGPELRIWGSSTLYPALLRAGLLDQLTTFTFPLVLGRGKRTFGEGTPAGALKLVRHEVGPSGVVIATYQPDGEVRHAAPNPAPPNTDETARQARIKAGTW